MTDFYKTRAGKKYIEITIPNLIISNNKLSDAIENQNKINEKLLIIEKKKLLIEKKVDKN